MDNFFDLGTDSREQKTILIFGISSFVGSNLAQFLKKDYKIVGTYFNTPVSIPGVITLPCDVLKKEEVQLTLYAFKPDFTIYAVGLTSLLECAESEELADALNTSGLFNVTDYCQRYKSQICYISSSYVFNGGKKVYGEMDIPDANTIFGKTKASGEFFIQKTSLNYIIFRSCPLYGRSYSPASSSWFESMEKKIFVGENLTCDNSVKLGFLDVQYLAMIIKISFENQVQNRLLQVSSQDVFSYYDFAKLYCETFGQSKGNVVKGKWHFPWIAIRDDMNPNDTTEFKMNIENIEGFLNIKLPTIKDSMEYSFKRFNGQRKSGKMSNRGGSVSFI